ncbi:MAG: alpha/beta hydrolase [Pseudomonadota bacterium]
MKTDSNRAQTASQVLIQERLQWEEAAARLPLPAGVQSKKVLIAGVNCAWVYAQGGMDDAAIMYLHGGGLVTGSIVTHLSLAASISVAAKIPVLLVDYRLLPEHPYPASLTDTLRVYRNLIEDYGFAAQRVVFGGDSSGAGLALAAMVSLRDSAQPLPGKSFCICGAFDMSLSGESMLQNDGLDPLLTLNELKQWRDSYLTSPAMPQLSALNAALHSLPEVLLLAGGNDLWLSDSVRVAEKIRHSGGQAQLRVWPDMGHMWLMDNALAESHQGLMEIGQFASAGW